MAALVAALALWRRAALSYIIEHYIIEHYIIEQALSYIIEHYTCVACPVPLYPAAPVICYIILYYIT